MIIHPNFEPVAIDIAGFSIQWYGLMYLIGLGIAWAIGHQLLKRPSFSSLRGLVLEDVIVAAAIGIIFGGRLGYILFYNPAYYAENPLQMFYLWKGGMSFHGGLIGVIAALWVLARIHAIPNVQQAIDEGYSASDIAVLETVTSHKNIFLRLVDLAAIMTPPGLGLGRIGNFINGELPGRVTSADLPWAMSFGVPDYLPRHPSQLYQFFIEGVVLMALMLYLSRAPRAPGWLAGAFLTAYAVGRFFVEFFREPDSHLGLIFLHLSMGQLLCIPMFLLGLALLNRLKISRALDAWRDKNSDLSLKTILYQTFNAEPDNSWNIHEQEFSENYGDSEEEDSSHIGDFFKRLISGEPEEEEEYVRGKVRLTRQQKRRLKKKKRKK